MSYGLVRSRWIDPDLKTAVENRLRTQELVGDQDGTVDVKIDGWLDASPDVEVVSIVYAADQGCSSALVIYREALDADERRTEAVAEAARRTAAASKAALAADKPLAADDGFAALEWVPSHEGSRHMATLAPGAGAEVVADGHLWAWQTWERAALRGMDHAPTEDQAKRDAYASWRRYQALRREVAGDAGH